MSVDFDRMAAHLPADQRKQLSRQYRRGAKNETAAFLSGFFLGIFGVHHFYLGEWARGFAHLIIPVAAAGVILAGVVGGLPSLPVTIVVAVLAIAAIIWEIVDLFGVDKNVYGRNLTLAESLIGAGALADNSSLVDAVSRLDSAMTGTAAVATVAAGGITAEDVSAARAMADERNNAIMEEYDSSTTKYISDDPNATSPGAPGTWSETMATSAAQEPSGEDTLDMPSPEYVTHTHTETAETVTDSYQFDRSPDATQPMAIPTATEAEAKTWPDHPLLEDAAAGAGILGAGALLAGAAHDGEAANTAEATGATAAASDTPDEQQADNIAGFAPLAVDVSTTMHDTTDAHPHVHHSGMVADTEVNPTHPVYVNLPDEGELASGGIGGDAALAGLAGAGAVGAGYLASQAQAHEQPPAEESALEMTPEARPEAAPTSGPLMKRIRMKRQIVVDGQVVREEVVEQLVPIDSDTKSAVAAMDTQLGHATKEEIAHMAHLDPDASLDLRQRYDAPPADEPPAE
jgi:TM2 domain-containing membrane protein YozV